MASSNDSIIISFPVEYNFSERSIRLVQGIIGIYFIYLADLAIQYPFDRSRLIYIGLSESKQNSIGNRLRGHLTGQSGNVGLMNYGATQKTKFTYQSLDVLRILGTTNLYELESFFLSSFLNRFGSFPICNNQSGLDVASPSIIATKVDVKWETFSPP